MNDEDLRSIEARVRATCERAVQLGNQQGLQWIEVVGAVNMLTEKMGDEVAAHLLSEEGLESNRDANRSLEKLREFMHRMAEKCMSELLYKHRGPV